MKKFKLIQKITKLHPAHGVDYGLSTYTGGMKDSGHWFEGKLLMLPKYELKRLLKKFDDIKPAELTVKLEGAVIFTSDGQWYHKEEMEMRRRFEEGIERFWFGFHDVTDQPRHVEITTIGKDGKVISVEKIFSKDL